MKFQIERTVYNETEHFVDVAFTLTDEDNISMYVPVTVMKNKLPPKFTEVDIMRDAARQAIPEQIAQYYTRKITGEQPSTDFFDILEKSLDNG